MIARELVVIKQHPAQNFAALVFTLGTELAGLLGEVIENDAGLRNLLVAMQKHRNFAHCIHRRAVFGFACFTVEKINPDRCPVQIAQCKHERCLVSVARFTKAIETI
jgi:hypothetical protein